MNGFIQLHRQLKDWEWYTDNNVKSLFIHCLLSANFKEKKWRGKTIKRGQFITSLSGISVETGMSIRSIRTAFDKLTETGEILKESTSTFTLVTCCKFDSYQSFKEQADTVPTNDRQSIDTVPTNDRQQLNNVNKDNKDNNEKNFKYLEQFQKIKKGDLPQTTQLDKHFHFGLFDDSWSENFQNEILSMWRYLESNETNPYYWGKPGTMTSQLSVIKSSLNEYSENEIIKSFAACKFSSKKTWPLYLKKEEKRPIDKTNLNFSYEIPQFKTKEQRYMYFLARYSIYKESGMLDEYKANTEYRKRAIMQQDAESLCFELELQQPELLDLEFNYVQR